MGMEWLDDIEMPKSDNRKISNGALVPLVLFNIGYVTAMLIAAGPLTKQPEALAYRLVLLQETGGFSVRNEHFVATPIPNRPLPLSYLGEGHYFAHYEFPQAVKRFAERLHEDAGHYDSLYE